MEYLIDPPSPFASLEEWQRFLSELLAIPERNYRVIEAIAEAEREIAKRKGSDA